MLPFLKNSQEASASGPIESISRTPDNDEDYDSLQSAAEDLSAAIHSKDISGICVALRAAFDILDSEPHEEGPHTNG